MITDAMDWLQSNWFEAVVGGVLVTLLGGLLVVGFWFFSTVNGMTDRVARPPGGAQELVAARSGSEPVDRSSRGEGSLRIQEARIRAESDDVRMEFDRVRALTRSRDGYVQSSNFSRGEHQLIQQATIRVPTDRFDTYLTALKTVLEITSFHVNNYRISIEDALDETDVLSNTLDSLEAIKERIDDMRDVSRKLDLLMKYNDRRLELVRELRRYQRQLGESRERSHFATVDLRIEQLRPVEVQFWPDDAGRRWARTMKELAKTFYSVVIDTPATIGIILLMVLQYGLYALAVFIPIWVLYRLVRRYWEGGTEV